MKQIQEGNEKSLNLQVEKCKIIEISGRDETKNQDQLCDQKNSQEKEADKLRRLIEKANEGMLTIIFDEKKLKGTAKAVQYAKENLNAKVVDEKVWAIVSDSKILRKLKYIKLLNAYVQRYKSLETYFRSQEINLTKFIAGLSEIQNCSREFDSNSRNCWRTHRYKGWGCRKINSIERNLLNINPAKTRKKFWYNYGKFDKDRNWIIDKNLISQIIFKEIKERGIDLCPFVSIKEITEEINSLPDLIKPDDVNFKITYTTDFDGNDIAQVPTNIEHIPDLPEEEKRKLEKQQKINELEYKIGMGLLEGKELREAKEQLLVLNGLKESYSNFFMMDLQPETGFRYSDS